MPKQLEDYLNAVASHDHEKIRETVSDLHVYTKRRIDVGMIAFVEIFLRHTDDKSLIDPPGPPKVVPYFDVEGIRSPILQLIRGCHFTDAVLVAKSVTALEQLASNNDLPGPVTYACELFLEEIRDRAAKGLQP